MQYHHHNGQVPCHPAGESGKPLQKELNSVGWAAAVAGLSISVAAATSSATVVVVGQNMRFANQLNNVLK